MSTRGSYWHPYADMAAVAGNELVMARGEGVHVFDAAGRRYLDGSASPWHCHVGHGREEIAEAIARQLPTLEAYQTFGDLANGPALELSAWRRRGVLLRDRQRDLRVRPPRDLARDERFAVEPDMVVLAKGITSGYVPLRCCARRRRASQSARR
jgi:adenosylmethionine-8-amino-7-oxononanoate aminotransferase